MYPPDFEEKVLELPAEREIGVDVADERIIAPSYGDYFFGSLVEDGYWAVYNLWNYPWWPGGGSAPPPPPPSQALIINTAVLLTAYANIPYAFQLSASRGTGSYTWSKISGDAWLSVSVNGLITGTPPDDTDGTITVEAADGLSTVQKVFALVVDADPPALGFSTTTIPNAIDSVAYSTQVYATGGVGSYTYSKIAGAAWLSVSAAGRITGTPPDDSDVTITVGVTDGVNNVQQLFNLTVDLTPTSTGGLIIYSTAGGHENISSVNFKGQSVINNLPSAAVALRAASSFNFFKQRVTLANWQSDFGSFTSSKEVFVVILFNEDNSSQTPWLDLNSKWTSLINLNFADLLDFLQSKGWHTLIDFERYVNGNFDLYWSVASHRAHNGGYSEAQYKSFAAQRGSEWATIANASGYSGLKLLHLRGGEHGNPARNLNLLYGSLPDGRPKLYRGIEGFELHPYFFAAMTEGLNSSITQICGGQFFTLRTAAEFDNTSYRRNLQRNGVGANNTAAWDRLELGHMVYDKTFPVGDSVPPQPMSASIFETTISNALGKRTTGGYTMAYMEDHGLDNNPYILALRNV